MNKHTQGSWSINDTHGKRYIEPAFEDSVIATVHKIGSGPRLTEEYEANSRLIAAAPEMLEALQRISKMHDHEKPSFELAQLMYEAACIARSAIAKATQ